MKLTRGRGAVALLIVALLAAFAVRLAYETPVYSHGSDYLHHLLLARSLAAGDGFQSGGSQYPDLSRPPLFPILTAGLSWLTGDIVVAAHVIVLLSSALVVIPLYSLARKSFGPRAGLCALPLGAFSGLIGSAGLMTEPLFLLLGLSAGAATWSASRFPRSRAFFVAGLLAGGSALARFEGLFLIPVLSVWVALAGQRTSRTRRFASGMLVLGGALSLYAPYAAWASVKLGRWAPAPGIQYLQEMRFVSDRLDLRSIDGPYVEWSEWSKYLMASDHESRVLETYFNTRVLLEPDPVFVVPRRSTDVAVEPPLWSNIVKRRIYITLGNLRNTPYHLNAAGFLPIVTSFLGMVGAIVALSTHRTRRALVYLLILGAASLVPALSHMETRYLYLPFAFGLVLSAGGWGYLAGRLSRLTGRARRATAATVHAALIALVALSGLHHHAGHRLRYQLTDFRRELAPIVAELLPPGPLLARQMHVPYWAGRAYRPIPMADPVSLLDYARAHGAAGLFFDSVQDMSRRPHLSALLEDPPPPGFRLLLKKPGPEGGEVRVFGFDLEPETLTDSPGQATDRAPEGS